MKYRQDWRQLVDGWLLTTKCQTWSSPSWRGTLWWLTPCLCSIVWWGNNANPYTRGAWVNIQWPFSRQPSGHSIPWGLGRRKLGWKCRQNGCRLRKWTHKATLFDPVTIVAIRETKDDCNSEIMDFRPSWLWATSSGLHLHLSSRTTRFRSP